MKNRFSKDLKKFINKIFIKVSKNKIYLYFHKKSYIFRLILGIFFILFGIFAFIMPLVPFSGLFLIIGFSILFDIKYVKSKFLYILNKSRLKSIFIKIYIKYFIKKYKIGKR